MGIKPQCWQIVYFSGDNSSLSNKIVQSNTPISSLFPKCIWKPELRRNLKMFSEERWGEENYVQYVRTSELYLSVFICKMNF